MVVRIGAERRYGVDDPPSYTVRGSGCAEMRVPPPVFDPAEEQGRAVGEQRRAGIEDRVHGIWPVGRGENGIALAPVQERLVSHRTGPALTAISTSAGCGTGTCIAFQRTSS